MKKLNLNIPINNNTKIEQSERKMSKIIIHNYSENEEREEKIEFEDIHEALLNSYKRKKYRKILEFINTRDSFLKQSNITHKLFFSHMKMNCILKIIEKKFNKYYTSSQIKGIEKWFKIADDSLYKFSNLISKIYKDEILDQCEYIILYNIKVCYYHSLYSKFKSKNKDYISYLILSEEIIKMVIDKITFPETFIFIVRIYLLLSNILIQDYSIYSALNYLLLILNICRIIKSNEIELQNNKENNYNDNLFITSGKKVIKENRNLNNYFEEINFLSALSYCLLGVCFEYLHDSFLSNNAYRQAKWITENLLNNNSSEYSNLFMLLDELTDKSQKEKDIIIILCKLDMVKFINKYKIKPKRKGLYSFEKTKLIQYQKMEKKIGKLKLNEPEHLQQILLTDDNENSPKSKKIKLMTNNVILLNYLSSEQFKPIIYDIKNMNIYNMNKDTELIIAKNIEKIRNKAKIESFSNDKKRSSSQNSINNQLNESFYKIKKLRNRKRFKTEFNNNLLDLNKGKTENIKPEINKQNYHRTSPKDLLLRSNKNLKFHRKLSLNSLKIEYDELLQNKELSLNDSYQIDDNSSSKSKHSFKKSFLNKKDKKISLKKLAFNSHIKQNKKEFNNDKNKNKFDNNKNKINKNNNQIINKEANKKINKVYKIKRKKVPRPMNNKLDKYIFNKIYIKKLEHIEKLTHKEYKFQKGILRNKSYEKVPELKFDPDKEKKDAEFFFIKTLDEKLKILEDKVQSLAGTNKIDFSYEKEMKRKLLNYQNRACTSLNYRDKENYTKLLKNIKIKNLEITEKKLNNKNIPIFRSNSSNAFNSKIVNENNNLQMNILGEKIGKIQNILNNSYNKSIDDKKGKFLFPTIKSIDFL